MPYIVGCLVYPILKGQQLHGQGVRDEIFDKLKASHPAIVDWMTKQLEAINVSDVFLEDDGKIKFWKAAVKVITIKY